MESYGNFANQVKNKFAERYYKQKWMISQLKYKSLVSIMSILEGEM